MTIVALANMEFEERKERLHSRYDRFAYSDDNGEGAFTLRCDRCNDERNNGGRGESGPDNRYVNGYDNKDQGGWMPRREYEKMINSCKTRRI